MSQLTFVINSIDWVDTCGGQIALNKLGHMLASAGHTVYLRGERKNPQWLGTLLPDDAHLPEHDPIVVYPEIVSGNPLGAKNVVRWLLYRPQTCDYDPNDLVFAYNPGFTTGLTCRIDGTLLVQDSGLYFFHDRGLTRKGDCHIVRKGHWKPRNLHRRGSLRLENYARRGGNAYLQEVFNRRRLFISYDHATFLSVQAALAGCISVVAPDPELTREGWMNGFPAARYGVAYGLEDVTWATKTMHLVRGHLLDLEAKSAKQVANFVAICERWFQRST